MNKQTGLPGREASWNKRTDTPLTPTKRPSSKPSPRKNGSSNTQTKTSQTASTNWTGQSRSFCSGWELDTTDLTPTCTQVQGWRVWDVPMQGRHHDCRTPTAALSTAWCYEAGHVAWTDATVGQALWQPGGAEEGNRHLHLAYEEEEMEKTLKMWRSSYT